MKKVQILYDWEQLCSFSPAVKLLILHLGTCLDVKAQLHCTKTCIIKACAFASVETVLEGQGKLAVLLHAIRFMFIN